MADEEEARPELDAEVSLYLRRLQIRLYDKATKAARIRTKAGLERVAAQMALSSRIAEIAYALEEGRLVIEPRTDEHIAAAAIEEMGFALGPDAEEPDYGDRAQ